MKLDRPRDSGLTMIAAYDDILRQNIWEADLPALLATVCYLTRDPAVLRPEWKPARKFGIAVSGLSRGASRASLLLRSSRVISRFQDVSAEVPTYDDVWNVGRWLMGETIEPFLQLTLEEMVVANHDPRRPR
jgi:hypothetical protein